MKYLRVMERVVKWAIPIFIVVAAYMNAVLLTSIHYHGWKEPLSLFDLLAGMGAIEVLRAAIGG